ncbi:TNF receptor-associated factor homolog 1a-like isoform X2 [Wolffia australiana]
MAGSISDDSSLESLSSSAEVLPTGQVCQTNDSVGEWRSSEQVENGIPSTSPPYWDTDEEDDFGPKPSDLYGKFTWKIENFSQISKRELRSNVFEVGGYKWYILIYPQGCDVCNHLSLFLCVANHDKLLPGWSHFAQFTIAVVNKDSKKSKYSDTLHRFWKKEHDWGWKKFMELSKLSEGFIVADALVIKAQVQVIREKAHRPFRCLDCQYRRELVRVYLSNVEQLCRRYVEEKRIKFNKLIEDKVRWSSFRTFWLGVDQSSRRWMSIEKTDTILKVVVKHFFIEKEVTSTLVMDSLYSGLKALEGQSKNKGSAKFLEGEEMAMPFIQVEKDLFSLTDDVLLLVERVVMEPILPKDEKASQNQSQNRTKDSSSGEEFSKDSIERDERRLTELGRRTVEIFILNHIFSRIEVAYQEAVALKRQEELIREEEAAGQAEMELRSRRLAAEKEKKAKKKQAKQKRSTRKGKDRGREDKFDALMLEKNQTENISCEQVLDELSQYQSSSALDKADMAADISDASDGQYDGAETLQQADVDVRDSSSGVEAASLADEGFSEKLGLPAPEEASFSSSSAFNVPRRKNASSPAIKAAPSLFTRGKTQHSKNVRDRTGQSFTDKVVQTESSGELPILTESIQRLERHSLEKEAVPTARRKATTKDQEEEHRFSKLLAAEKPLPTELPQSKQGTETCADTSNNAKIQQNEKTVSASSKAALTLRPEPLKQVVSLAKNPPQQVSALSRPPSAPVIPGPRPAAVPASVAHPVPLMSRSVSAAGRLGADSAGSSTTSHGNVVFQSYRNAIIGKTTMSSGVAVTPSFSSRPSLGLPSHGAATAAAVAYPQSSPSFVPSSSIHVLQRSATVETARPGLTFGSMNPEALQSRTQWADEPMQPIQPSRGVQQDHQNLVSSVQALDVSSGAVPRSYFFQDATMSLPDEFPHLDIINDLLNEEHQTFGREDLDGYPHHTHHPALSRQYTFPMEISTSTVDVSSSNGGRLFSQMGHQGYDEGIQRFYGSPSRHYAADMMDYSPYVNGQVQWPMRGAATGDIQQLDGSGYSYQQQQHHGSPDLGYGIYHRPASGP